VNLEEIRVREMKGNVRKIESHDGLILALER